MISESYLAPKRAKPTFLSLLTTLQVLYAPEYMLITNPTANSYKRFDRDAIPALCNLKCKNRLAMVRIPTHKPGKHVATRAELRTLIQPQILIWG